VPSKDPPADDPDTYPELRAPHYGSPYVVSESKAAFSITQANAGIRILGPEDGRDIYFLSRSFESLFFCTRWSKKDPFTYVGVEG